MTIGTLGQADITIAGQAFFRDGDTKFGANPTFKILYAAHAANNSVTFNEQGSATGYTPGASRKLVVGALKTMIAHTTGSNNMTGAPLYSDNDMGSGTGGTPTNPVYLIDGQSLGLVSLELDQGQTQEFALNFEVPEAKYLGVAQANVANIVYIAYCYEVDV